MQSKILRYKNCYHPATYYDKFKIKIVKWISKSKIGLGSSNRKSKIPIAERTYKMKL